MQNRFLTHLSERLFRDFGEPEVLWQVGALLGLLAVAWWCARVLRRKLDARRQSRFEAVRFGAESLNKALFPLLGMVFVAIAQLALAPFIHTSLLRLALVPLCGITVIYMMFYAVRRVFRTSGSGGTEHEAHALLFVFEKLVTVIVWLAMLLTVMGIQDDVVRWMASVRFNFANAHMTLLSLASGVLWVCVTLIVAMWAGALIDDRLMRARSLDANLKVVLARVARALMILAAILVSLSIVGIDITVLGVFGGALGVGLGFGLQKIASNYVSGFIILLDRSLRLGDMISVGGSQGTVTQIRTRYTVVRGLDGIETLIPNEKLITDVVQNHSSYLTRGNAKVAVQVSYECDVERAMQLLVEATQGVERVLQDPAPAALLASFGADGINLELSFWIEDAAKGTGGVKSQVNRCVWRLFSENGIAIPYAQREIRIVQGAAAGPVRNAERWRDDGAGVPQSAV
ncbi:MULTISPECIES: mechanosensitive ion channel domain-containing protein [unclassified Caballeronia]|uniref:mechanosensitive ion channel family protein n=1 Tax=unclassified Caballeronia TaxID=2646786 RepID=UPI0028644E42|nr:MULTISPECIES: mechanosensitive ion channel domain-containing protein [unclassified Caballeronia]MDR5736481.1 mechanosensitive ion channel [Caballeronia sp. LZ016]MDR5811041.1 mechanosensitive ion channel [Caballeronia sp. LZ019]